jgi:hypothetical protein
MTTVYDFHLRRRVEFPAKTAQKQVFSLTQVAQLVARTCPGDSAEGDFV